LDPVIDFLASYERLLKYLDDDDEVKLDDTVPPPLPDAATAGPNGPTPRGHEVAGWRHANI
jgi:hypothetical protein